MTANLSATRDGGRATFLLEVALDRARLKQRLAAVLLAERTERGLGDARRFPQPAMAAVLGYSLRQYQRLEDPDDPNLPSWNNIEVIADKLGLDPSDLFGDDGSEPKPTENGSATPPPQSELDALRQDLQEQREQLARMEALLHRALGEHPDAPQRRQGSGG